MPERYEMGEIRTDRGLINDKGNQVFDVRHRDYGNGGAKLNGADDDTLAFRDACSDAAQSGGGIVYIPDGTLKVSANVTAKARVSVRGRGQEVSKIYNANQSTAAALTFTDSTTSNKEHRFSGISDVWMYGNTTGTGALCKVENPYHWTAQRTLFDVTGGIGLDIEKGANSSTYGQNVFIDHCWIRQCRGGGLRMYKSGGGSSVDIAKVSNTSLNDNGKYGIYLQQVVICELDNLELAGYEYGNVVAANQAIPIVLNGGNNIALRNISFEGNGGNGATPNYNVRTGWDGDAQAAAANDTQVLVFDNNDFKPSVAPGGALTHVRLKNVRSVKFDSNFFEGDLGLGQAINGVHFDDPGSASLGAYTFINNRYASLTNKFAGAARAMALLEIPYTLQNDAAGAIPGFGYLGTDLPEVWARSMFTGEAYDRFQVTAGGTILRGPGSAAPSIATAWGTASPEGNVTSGPGGLYTRNNAGTGELWVKTSGTDATGWTQVTIP